MKSNIIHETIIRDIVEIIQDIKDLDQFEDIASRNKSYRSIAQSSSELTLVFPVIVSRTVDIRNALMVAKAIERKAVTMLQMLFSAIDISSSEDGLAYLRNFHTNLKLNKNFDVDDFIYVMDSLDESGQINIIDRKLYDNVIRDLRNINFVLPDSISETSLCDYRYVKSYMNNTVICEDSRRHKSSKSDRVNFKDFKDQLLDTDVKKANELVPTMMVVNFNKPVKGDRTVKSTLVAGVKAKIYPVDSVDMMNRMVIKNADHNGFLNLVKATTREISFLRDFLFAIDNAKLDALSQSRKGSSSKLWKILERRGIKSKFNRALRRVNDASAISTIVISQEEVEYLKKTENIDLNNPGIMRPIMESYNLMGACIIDESIEVCKFIFDSGDDIFEETPFSALERESNDNSYKKIINLMSKVSR